MILIHFIPLSARTLIFDLGHLPTCSSRHCLLVLHYVISFLDLSRLRTHVPRTEEGTQGVGTKLADKNRKWHSSRCYYLSRGSGWHVGLLHMSLLLLPSSILCCRLSSSSIAIRRSSGIHFVRRLLHKSENRQPRLHSCGHTYCRN